MTRLPARPLRLAHRGDWRQAPENTVVALLAALALPGCDGLEFDVRRAADGTPVLLHDETLERVQGQPGRADEHLPVDLAQHGVPTLANALNAIGPEAFLDVELKGDPGPAVIEVLEAARGPGLENAAISSFDFAALERIGSARPAWARWLNADDLRESTLTRARQLGCRAVSARWTAIDAHAVARARAVGLDVAAWTVRERPVFDRLASLGVVAVCVEDAALDVA